MTLGIQGAPERDGYAYPLRRRNDRELPGDWGGPVYLWDIDNTYLQTEWDGLGDLIRIRLEAAEDKRPVPGAVELLAGLRRVDHDGARAAFYFVSASPETMRNVLEKRMLLDGVLHDGITFRDLRKLRYMRDIFGYKVAALLLYRLENPVGGRELLFGDDREHDPFVYTLYAQVCSGKLRGDTLVQALATHGVRRSARGYIRALADELPEHDAVEWALIRRLRPESGPAPDPIDPRVIYVDDYAQAGALLASLGLIGLDDLREVTNAVQEGGLGREPLGAVQRVAARLSAERVEEVRAEMARWAGA